MKNAGVFKKRAYRKEMQCDGLIYFGHQERKIRVLNISLTGALAELESDATLNNINALFAVLQEGSDMDIFLPDVCLAGGANLVRAESTVKGFLIGIEFRDVLYSSASQMRNRTAYRKAVTVVGDLSLNGRVRDFVTENVSVAGAKIHVGSHLEVVPGAVGNFRCAALGLEGQVEVVWARPRIEGTDLGLQFHSLSRDRFIGIPRFSRDLAKAA
jgi:PilZ domain